jgi:hypothetical protein
MLTGSIPSIRFWSRRIWDWREARYSSVWDSGGSSDDEVVDFGLALLLELGEFLLFPLEFLEVELELAQFGFGFVAILFVGAEFFVEDD